MILKIDVLGTEYTIEEATASTDEKLADYDGYCDTSVKVCVIDKMEVTDPKRKQDMSVCKKSTIRHELVHAFLYESGLDCCSWANIEEMVDWFAIQAPKLLAAFKAADAL